MQYLEIGKLFRAKKNMTYCGGGYELAVEVGEILLCKVYYRPLEGFLMYHTDRKTRKYKGTFTDLKSFDEDWERV